MGQRLNYDYDDSHRVVVIAAALLAALTQALANVMAKSFASNLNFPKICHRRFWYGVKIVLCRNIPTLKAAHCCLLQQHKTFIATHQLAGGERGKRSDVNYRGVGTNTTEC